MSVLAIESYFVTVIRPGERVPSLSCKRLDRANTHNNNTGKDYALSGFEQLIVKIVGKYKTL